MGVGIHQHMMLATEKPQLDELFRLLSNPRRRYVLYHLTKESDSVTADDLATRIAMREAMDPEMNTNGNHINSVRASLRHTHLPKLEDHGVITVGPTSGTVELAEEAKFGPFLDEAARIDLPEQATGDD